MAANGSQIGEVRRVVKAITKDPAYFAKLQL
jgi:hypothetical protein